MYLASWDFNLSWGSKKGDFQNSYPHSSQNSPRALQSSLTLLWKFIPRSIIHLIICYQISINTHWLLRLKIASSLPPLSEEEDGLSDTKIERISYPRKCQHFSLLTYLLLLKHNSQYQEFQSCTVFPATSPIYFWSHSTFTHLLKQGMCCCYRKVPVLNGSVTH